MGAISKKVTNAMTNFGGVKDADYALVNSYNFVLRVEGIYDLPCKSVKVFSKNNEYMNIQEGGLNDYVHMVRKPISQPFTFQVERYVGLEMVDPLANGTELVLPVFLYINHSVRDDWTAPVRYYMFTGCRVQGKEYGELNAERSGLLTETTTIAYNQMLTFTLPVTDWTTNDPWEFSNDGKSSNEYARTVKDAIPSFATADGVAANKKQTNPERKFTYSEDSPVNTSPVEDQRKLYKAPDEGSKDAWEKKAEKGKFTFAADAKNTDAVKGQKKLFKAPENVELKTRKYEYIADGAENAENLEATAANYTQYGAVIEADTKEKWEGKAAKNRFTYAVDADNTEGVKSQKKRYVVPPQKEDDDPEKKDKKEEYNNFVFSETAKNTDRVKGQRSLYGAPENMEVKGRKYEYSDKDLKNTDGVDAQKKLYKAPENKKTEPRKYEYIVGDAENPKNLEATEANYTKFGGKINSPTKEQFEKKAKKYPPTRSAQQVMNFLKKK